MEPQAEEFTKEFAEQEDIEEEAFSDDDTEFVPEEDPYEEAQQDYVELVKDYDDLQEKYDELAEAYTATMDILEDVLYANESVYIE